MPALLLVSATLTLERLPRYYTNRAHYMYACPACLPSVPLRRGSYAARRVSFAVSSDASPYMSTCDYCGTALPRSPLANVKL